MSFKHIMSRVISPTYIKTSSIAKMAPLIDGWIVARRIKGWEFETVEVSVPRAAKLRLAKLAYDHKKYLGKLAQADVEIQDPMQKHAAKIKAKADFVGMQEDRFFIDKLVLIQVKSMFKSLGAALIPLVSFFYEKPFAIAAQYIHEGLQMLNAQIPAEKDVLFVLFYGAALACVTNVIRILKRLMGTFNALETIDSGKPYDFRSIENHEF